MNGVEAAASLFGTEESASDLFATLGTESTALQPPVADPFFNTSDLSPENEAFDFSSHHPAQPSPFLEYGTDPQVAQAHTTLESSVDGSSESTYAEQRGQHEQNTSTSAYSNSIPATGYSTYAPSTYSVPPATQQIDTPRTMDNNTYAPSVYSSYSAYDPPTPGSSYTPYTSMSLGKPSYAPQVVSSTSPQPPYNNVTSVTPSTKSITRPKVSNAYDPPFIPSVPSRRTSRSSGGTSQLYSQYQSPTPSSYASSTESSTYTAGLQYQQSVAPYGSAPTEASPDVYSTGTSYAHSSLDEQAYATNGYPQGANIVYKPAHTAQPEQSYPLPDSFSQPASRAISTQDNKYEVHVPKNTDTEPHATHHAYSTPLLQSSMVDSISPSATRQDVLGNSSHEPFPYYSSVQKDELQDPEVISVSSDNNQPPLQSPYQASKLIATSNEVHDPYNPRVKNVNNYIPRTSSPLSVHNGRLNDVKKSPAPASYFNGVTPATYIPASKPLVSMQTAPPLSSINDDSITRQTPHWSESVLASQDIIVKATSSQYAPSPSLIGANDPLARTSARAPVVTFGFGGKMITCFHGMPGLNAGFDVALSARTSSELKVHTLQKVLPENTFNSPGSTYPGPLLSDPGTSSLSLVRPNQAAQTKTKKAGVLTYLSGRASEIHQGLGYVTDGEKQKAKNKLILVQLLSVMVENDGRLLGTPQSDSAVRLLLVPRLEGLATTLQDGVSLQAAFNSGPPDETPISVTTLRPSSLDKIEELLLRGDRRQAYQYAMDQKLWAHAMVISSSIDKDSWKEVVNEFLRSELGVKEETTHAASLSPTALPQGHRDSRDSLRVAYSLFSGQGAAAVLELAPVNLLHQGTGRLQAPLVPSMSTITPRTPHFPPMQPGIPVPPENLQKWAETAAMIISSPLTPETSGALTSLGDQLLLHNWVEAAHACFLLSSQTSLLGGVGNPSTRITLVGSKNPTEASRDADAIILSEILEFALSLVPAAKGQEPFHGLPHLQAYRFIRAISLAETGDIQLANRYCEGIAASLGHGSPYTTIALLEQLQGLQQRISGVFHGDKSGSWIASKLTKPSLDTIGGWLEGRFTKLVTGESDSPTPTADHPKSSNQPFAGPFAHYSTIASTTPSERSSPQPKFASLSAIAPPQRTTSAMAISNPTAQVQIERSSSAMEYIRQKPSLHTAKDSASSISSSQSSPTGYGLNDHSRYDEGYTPKSQRPVTPVQGASSWWGSSDENTATDNTPTVASFMRVEESSILGNGDGFISLMDNQPFTIGPQSHSQQPSSSSSTVNDEDDDLGLGNSKPPPEKLETVSSKERNATPGNAAPPTAQKTDPPPAGGWLSRWWKGNDSTAPGPIKASLGEESAFYYDKEQKRWVNKKAGGDDVAKPASLPPPPSRAPSRAQTASPGMTGAKQQSPDTPPPRSVSVNAMGPNSEPPTNAPLRIRSNLAPPNTESIPSTPTRLNTGTPPPPRPRSGAAKRNIRSRYVDVFQQEGGGAA